MRNSVAAAPHLVFIMMLLCCCSSSPGVHHDATLLLKPITWCSSWCYSVAAAPHLVFIMMLLCCWNPSPGAHHDATLLLLWPGASQWWIYYHRMWRQLSTTCSNATAVAQRGTPSCSRPLPATDNGVRDGISKWLAVTPTLHRVVPSELYALHSINDTNRKTCCRNWGANTRHWVYQANALPV